MQHACVRVLELRSGKSFDPWGKKFFHNLPTTFDDTYSIAIVTPTIHYCMGGLEIDANGLLFTLPTWAFVGRHLG